MNKKSIDTFKRYIKTFNHDSTNTILEAAIGIRNLDTRQKAGRDIWEISSAQRLMERINEIFGLNVYKLQILGSTTDNLSSTGDKQLNKELEICHKEECKELMNILSEQGRRTFYHAIESVLQPKIILH